MHQNNQQEPKRHTKLIKKGKRNSENHREDHLRQQAGEYELLENIILARHLRNIITIEQQEEVHQHISRFTKKRRQSISNT